MIYSDEDLEVLIRSGLSDEEIIRIVHDNTPPADLYGAVADVVTEILEGNPATLTLIQDSQSEALRELKDSIDFFMDNHEDIWEWWKDMGVGRYDTKKIVMTFLYGSTEFGNRDDIKERIFERADEALDKGLDAYWDVTTDQFNEERKNAVTLMVRLTRGAMALVCPSTVETMRWIQKIAGILGEMDRALVWVTPLNLLCSQDNPNTKTKRIEIYQNSKKISQLSIQIPATNGKRLNTKKMQAGAPPDFIHSMDATHLMMTVNETDSEYFLCIHDSAATQCADTPLLDRALKTTFIEMYAETDILFDMWMLNGGDELNLPEPNELGTLDVTQVLQSNYFFG